AGGLLAAGAPAGGDVPHHALALDGVGHEGGREVGGVLHVVLGDRVDLDAVARHLAPDRLGEAVHPRAGRGVGRVVGQAGKGGGGRHVDDLAAAGGPHHPQRGAQAEERLVEQARLHLAPRRVADLLHRRARRRVGVVVHQHVEAAEARHHRLHRALRLHGAAQVAAQHQHVAAQALRDGRERLGRAGLAVVQRHRGALAAELLGDRGAHEVAHVGDERDLAGELHGPQPTRGFAAAQGRGTVRDAGQGGAAAVADELLESFKARYAFPLDDFQLRAISAILDGKSVIVSAPTGSGKTLVAEFAIHAALHRGRRIAYTTPLKALSNQKYADFGRQWGAENVGILTGDVKVNPRAPVVVMTTEILRNMFYSGGLPGLDTVVLDECHYMGDEGRGTVWEEIIVAAPRDVLLVGLSATVANVKEIADWISIVHRPIVPIFHPQRPVPLHYSVADLAGDIHDIDHVRSRTAHVVGDERRGPDDRGRWYTRRVVDPVVLIEALEERGWLPAIYFIFSRAGCERAMQDVLADGRSLI